MQTKDCISKRRSIRGYNDESVERSAVERLVGDAVLAPSGMNRQPWKFYIESDSKAIMKIASYSSSQGEWIKTAKHLLFVFLDKNSSYNEECDLMAIGAAIENFMLSACDEGIGTCWLGGILSSSESILEDIGVKDAGISLKAVITVGRFDGEGAAPVRKAINEVLI